MVQATVMSNAIYKKVALLAVSIREGFPKEESFCIPLWEIGPDLIDDVPEFPEAEIYWENHSVLKE